MRDGMGIVWIQCSLENAWRIAEIGSITLGITVVRIELLRRRPVQCFRCWRFGHVRSEVERTGLCFRYGATGHPAGRCNSQPKYLVCEELKKDFNHRMGSPQCLYNQGLSTGVQRIRRRPVGGTYVLSEMYDQTD